MTFSAYLGGSRMEAIKQLVPIYWTNTLRPEQNGRHLADDIFKLKYPEWNKANLRGLIAVTSLVILLKLDSNCWLISLCDLDIWWMTSKTNKAPLLHYIKRYTSFQIHWWIQIVVTFLKCSIWVKIDDFFVLRGLDNWQMTLKNNRASLL